MRSPENHENQDDATRFKSLLDGLFAAGTPRRHAPGMGLGEEEILLQAPSAAGLIIGPPPERVRAIRPKVNNSAPLKPRPSSMLSGPRLDLLQHFGDNREAYTFTEFYIHPGDGQIHRRIQGDSGSLYSRHTTTDARGIHEVYYRNMGALETWNADSPLSAEEVTELFTYIEGATPRDPEPHE